MIFSVKDGKLEFLGQNNNDLKNYVIVYFGQEYEKYNKILVFNDYKVKESAVLLYKNYCEIPKDIKGNLIGLKVVFTDGENQFETNKVSARKE